MKIGIAGFGAMGSLFAAKLLEHNNEVVAIDGWDQNVNTLNEKGLTFEDNGETKNYPIKALFPKDVNEKFDLILLFTKAMQLDEMLTNLGDSIDDTLLLVLANGVGNVETIEGHSSRDNIMAGTTLWSSELVGPGSIKASGTGSINLQYLGTSKDAKVAEIVAEMNASGLNVTQSNDVISVIWTKAAFNSVINTYCGILDCSVGQFGTIKGRDFLMDSVLDEISEVAAAEKVEFHKEKVKATLEEQFDPKKSGNHYPSLHQDLSKGRKTEIDFLNGYFAKLGEKHGINVDDNSLLTSIIHAKEDLNELKK